MPSIMWFRRDLRLADHPALAEAARPGPVVGLFVVDPRLVRRSGEPRLRFLRASLDALDRAMGGALVVRVGDPVTVVPEMAATTGARSVYCTADAGPFGRRRDRRVGEALAASGATLRGIGSPYAVVPGTVTKPDGAPYSVFTAFWRSWQAIEVPRAAGRPDVVWERLPSDAVEWPASTGGPRLPDAGEDAAWARWRSFARSGLGGYGAGRDVPGVDGTSRMSTYLRWGVVHPRQLLAELDGSSGATAYRRELCWREFYADVLWHRPDSAWRNLDRRYDAMETDTDLDRFAAWQEARTGFPLVDAGMRQLAATGWMHNRVRMVTASFLVKDLHLPWQWGARHFMDHLVDGDLASNNHGWQWVAGSGTDAAPYHRILSPERQAERFDPDGVYVRRWLTEAVAPRIVDHGVERTEALRRRAALAGHPPAGGDGR